MHVFNTNPAELNRLTWHDPSRRPAGLYGLGWQATIDDDMSDAEMVTLARNWDSLCLFAWRPHMFNPQLRHWLHRICVPTLVLWGESDGVVPVTYGSQYASLIQNCRIRNDRRGRTSSGTGTACRLRSKDRAFPVMMFIVRVQAARVPPLEIKMAREIRPRSSRSSTGLTDYFCLGDAEAARTAGWIVVALHDGWYADDTGGGVAIWGQGQFWEVRDTPFSIKEACGPEAWPADASADRSGTVNVRQAIFQG